MYRKLLTLLTLFTLFFLPARATRHTVTNNGNLFSPANITIQAGDTVVFNIANDHNVVEVSQSTYNNNSNLSNGGFTLPFGGGMVVGFNSAGTYYYVCSPHASMGMKGTITVTGSTGIAKVKGNDPVSLNTYPNPAKNRLVVNLDNNKNNIQKIIFFNITGQEVYSWVAPSVVSQADIDVSSLPRGIYMIEVFTDTRKLTRRITLSD